MARPPRISVSHQNYSKNEASGSEMKRVIDENRPSEEVKGEGK